jgi:NAD+ synthase
MDKIYNNIINQLKEFQEHNHVNGYVLGVSGGKDSTVVAKLLVDSIDKENVLGVLMPNGEQKDIEDSKKVCDLLNIDYTIIDISHIYRNVLTGIQSNWNSDIPNIWGGATKNGRSLLLSEKALTNVAPRIRMTILYAIAQSLGYLVAGTGNYSEQFIGWFTKWGDGACDINPIAHLTCTEVIELGDYLGLPYELIHKTPADGLTGKSDEENFGFTYAELDAFILKQREFLSAGRLSSPYTELEKKILNMCDITRHKFQVVTLDNFKFK